MRNESKSAGLPRYILLTILLTIFISPALQAQFEPRQGPQRPDAKPELQMAGVLAQDFVEILRKGRARQHQVGARLLGFALQIVLHVRDKREHRRRAGGRIAFQFRDQRDRIKRAIVEVHDNESRLRSRGFDQFRGITKEFRGAARLLRCRCNLRDEHQVGNRGKDPQRHRWRRIFVS